MQTLFGQEIFDSAQVEPTELYHGLAVAEPCPLHKCA